MTGEYNLTSGKAALWWKTQEGKVRRGYAHCHREPQSATKYCFIVMVMSCTTKHPKWLIINFKMTRILVVVVSVNVWFLDRRSLCWSVGPWQKADFIINFPHYTSSNQGPTQRGYLDPHARKMCSLNLFSMPIPQPNRRSWLQHHAAVLLLLSSPPIPSSFSLMIISPCSSNCMCLVLGISPELRRFGKGSGGG